jgi:hypothetical protein
MKSSYMNNMKDPIEKTNLWDAFTNHIDSIYYPGASELLNDQSITFEYESFKTYFAQGQ